MTIKHVYTGETITETIMNIDELATDATDICRALQANTYALTLIAEILADHTPQENTP